MRRVALLALCVFCAVLAGTARADVFQVVPTETTAFIPPPPAQPEVLDQAQLLGLWQGAGAQYGIPWQVLAAINKVESDFGRNMGPSSAGAVGWMQFMPATWLQWGVDANGDGTADPWNAADAIYSAGRYLAASGGGADIDRAVFAYNHADWYVNEVLGLAQLFGTDQTVAFSVDKLQQQLDAARAKVAGAADGERAAARTLAHLRHRAAVAALLSDRLELERRATLAAIGHDLARRTLARARQDLAKAQKAAKAPSFDPAVGSLMGAPSSASSGYVFPVGGGPGVVTASHTHHDYPAVDIAAPLGEPVYALADSVVVRSWSAPDPRCGIGLTLQAFDGQTWTYCHLAVLDASIQPGVALTAGRQIGLVGATGDASGPHLHLQLQPATQWPQLESWFLSFAGTAYSWQDGPEAAAAPVAVRGLASMAAPRKAPVFALVAAPSSGVVMFTRGNP